MHESKGVCATNSVVRVESLWLAKMLPEGLRVINALRDNFRLHRQSVHQDSRSCLAPFPSCFAFLCSVWFDDCTILRLGYLYPPEWVKEKPSIRDCGIIPALIPIPKILR